MSRNILVTLICNLSLILPFNTFGSNHDLPKAVSVWYHAETELLSRAVDVQRIISPSLNSQDPKYSPETHEKFKIHGYWLPAEKFKTYDDGSNSDVSNSFKRTVNGKKEILFIVHPESYDLYDDLDLEKQPKETFNALATASSRSLLVWKDGADDKPFIAKLSLNKSVGGVVRSIKGGEIASSIGISSVLNGSRNLPKNSLFMPEVFSAIPEGKTHGGQIIRELGPILNEAYNYIPLFSLYGGDGEPLLNTWIKNSRLRPQEFLKKKIISPFIKAWAELAIEHGILMEPHAQNVLIEIKNGQPTGRYVFRDFGGFNLDLKYRKSLGKLDTNLPTFSGSTRVDYHQSSHEINIIKSLYYYFEGGFLYNIQRMFERYYGIKANYWTRWDILEELDRSLGNYTKKRHILDAGYNDLIENVNEARKSHLKIVKEKRLRCVSTLSL